MPKIVILGSCRFEPYEILAVPNKIPGAWNTDEGYKIAFETFGPAIEEADLVLVYAPDGIGRHTKMDLDYARSKNKRILIIGKDPRELRGSEHTPIYTVNTKEEEE